MINKRFIPAIAAGSLFLCCSISYAALPHAPHNENSEVLSVTCDSCHLSILPDTNRSDICVGCHDGDPAIAVADHSAAVIHAGEDPVTWPYGNWVSECLDCHDPHLHFQLTHVSQSAGDLFIITGSIDSITPDSGNGTTEIAYSTPDIRPGWELPTADWSAKTSSGRGLIFVADSNNPIDTFEIVSATSTLIDVNGVMDSGLIASLTNPQDPTTFGIIYGQLLKSMVVTPNSGIRSVKLFDPNGGFVDGNNNPAPGGLVDKSATAIPEGLCQVCHTQTQHWSPAAPPVDDHYYSEKCSGCHLHSLGFRPSCEACHGYPPGALVSNPGPTGSLIAGAHDYHVTTLGMACEVCHYNSVGNGTTHNSNLTVTLGFYAEGGAIQGGSYSGQLGVRYDATTTAPSTVVTDPGDGTKQCANLYCHSQGTSGAPPFPAPYVLPAWDGTLDPLASGVTCAGCHGTKYNQPTPMITTNSHPSHIDNFAVIGIIIGCSRCHMATMSGTGMSIGNQDNHINKLVNIKFRDDEGINLDTDGPTYYGALTTGVDGSSKPAGSAIGNCANVYCHSVGNLDPAGIVVPDPDTTADFKSIAWDGSAVDCSGCHGDSVTGRAHPVYTSGTAGSITANSHIKHVQSALISCDYCHIDTTSDTALPPTVINDPWPITHIDRNETVVFKDLNGITGAYDSTVGQKNCANTYCHSDGTSVATSTLQPNTSPQWGGTPLLCSSCHGYGPGYVNGSPKANSHSAHSGFVCSYCHNFTTTTGDTITNQGNHTNQVYNVTPMPGLVSFTYIFAADGGTCSNLNCHNDTSVQWGQSAPVSVSCLGCHLQAQGSRRAMVSEFPNNSAHAHYGADLDENDCLVCHDQSTHMDGFVDLIDPDGGSNYRFNNPTDLTVDPDLSNFCMNCHDSNGASRLGTSSSDPFGNGNIPPNTASRFMGTLQWNELQYPESCLPPSSSIRPVNSHHDISDADQAFSNAKLECLNCHGAHNASQTQPVSDPNDTLSPWSGSDNDFCLVCHSGGAGPGAPGFPAGVTGPLFPVPSPDPNAGLSCGGNLIYDCQGNCVDLDLAQSYIGDGYCDNGKYGFYLWCDAFSNDGDDCGPPCQDNNCSALTGIETCNYNGPPWWTEYNWNYSAHGNDSKRGWAGYALTPQAPSYVLDCKACHDPHGSYSTSNTAGNPYMIRDSVDGTGFVDDGSREGTSFGWDDVAQDWSQYGTAGDVVITIPEPLTGPGPVLEALCIKCHSDWDAANSAHNSCGPGTRPACIFCHSHGGYYDGYDWGLSGNDTLCPAP